MLWYHGQNGFLLYCPVVENSGDFPQAAKQQNIQIWNDCVFHYKQSEHTGVCEGECIIPTSKCCKKREVPKKKSIFILKYTIGFCKICEYMSSYTDSWEHNQAG